MQPDTSLPCDTRPSPNHGDRRDRASPRLLILHYTGMPTSEGAIERLCDPKAEVSSHYVVCESGAILQLVPESRRAWHAGAGSWKTIGDINSASIGIEIVNQGHDGNLPPYPAEQIDALATLCRDICERHGILPECVLAHSDVAPRRKRDPGEHFPWKRMHALGIGHWVEPAAVSGGRFLSPGENGPPVSALQTMLALYGYSLSPSGIYDVETFATVSAFQRHFRQQRVDGIADVSTITTLRNLIAALPDRHEGLSS